MKINWKIRFKNPVFWRNVVIALIAPILTYLGVKWTDITTWSVFAELFKQAISNPVILVSVIVSIWNAINDPTTVGDSDSTQALNYTEPKKEV